MIQCRPMALALSQQLESDPRRHDSSVMLTPLCDVGNDDHGDKDSY